jgi:endo-1,4-beta-xylanase
MKKKTIFITFLLLFSFSVYASSYTGDIIYNGDFNNDLDYWYLGGVDEYCNYILIPENEYNILQLDIFSEPERFWNVQLNQEYKISVAEEDILFLKFNLKNPDGEVIVAVQDNGNPWRKYIGIEISNSSETINYKIAFDGSINNWNAGEVELCFFFGENVGVFEISNISFKNLGSEVDIESLNADIVYNPFFGTQENTDDWKQPALERIENIRKSHLTVTCVDNNGNHLNDVKVTISQTKKYFPFGTAVAANLFGGGNYNPTYIEKTEELFNMITIENHLKWKVMDSAHPSVDYVFDWAEEKNIPVHGHCLFWPSYSHCPDWLEGLPTDEIYDNVISHVKDYATEFNGKVVHWDVLNEAISNDEIWHECGIELLADCYTTAKENDPTALLMYNDYSLLRNDPIKQDQVIDLVNQLIGMRAPIEGLGIQSHLSIGGLVTPENALKNLDKMSTLKLPIYITELDIGTEEHWEFQAEYFTDLVTSIYSHPSVKGIIQWGFWEGSHWRPDTALYNYDWTPRPVGLAFEDLMFNEWRTDITSYTNESGTVTENCFHGDYEVAVKFEKYTITDTVSVLPEDNASLLITINLDNNPPTIPSTPDGPAAGKAGIKYTYTTSSSDPDENQLHYKWDFGDGSYSDWLGPYESGVITEVNHTWSKKGSYELKVKTKDIYNAESKWSDPLPINMPKNKQSASFIYFLEKLIKRFPLLEQIFSTASFNKLLTL